MALCYKPVAGSETSALRRRRRDRDIPAFHLRLVGRVLALKLLLKRPIIAVIAVPILGLGISMVPALPVVPAMPVRLGARGLVAVLTSRLVLLLRRLHGAQDAEIVLRVLIVALRHDAVTAAGRVATELQIPLEELLRRTPQTQVGPLAVENMVAVERHIAALVTDDRPTPAASAAVVAPAHALHIIHCSANPLARAMPFPALRPDFAIKASVKS